MAIAWPLIIVGLLVIILCLHRRNKKHKNAPPGPWNLPVVGYLPWLDPKAPYLPLTKLSQKYGPIYGLYLGNIYTVVISDVNLLKKIFFKDTGLGRAPLHVIESATGGKGIVFTQGDLWRHQRKVIHSFMKVVGASKVSQNRNKIETSIINNILEFVQFVESKGNRVVLAPKDFIFHSVGSLISLITLGKSWSRDDKVWKRLLGAVEEGAKHMGVAAPSNFLPFLTIFPKYKRAMHLLNNATGTIRDILGDAINEKCWMTDFNLVHAFMIEKSKHEGTDNEKFYDEEQHLRLIMDIFGAGIESTVNSILWFLLYMAGYQEVQNKIRQELNEILRGNLPSLENVSELPYVEATIAEVSRIRTLGPLGIPHGALNDIEVDEFTIVKGAMIVPLTWAIHMDPKVWGDPENFRPERFLDNEGKFYQPESFIPFQIGKRMCPGMALAKMQIFLFVTTILQKFRIECEDPSKLDLTGCYGITLNPNTHNLIFSVA